MPNLDPSQPAPADAEPVVLPTVVPAGHDLSDLSTGGWRRRLTGLPTVLGRPLARWADQGRSALATVRGQRRTDQDPAGR